MIQKPLCSLKEERVAGPKGRWISCDLPEHRSVPTAAQHCQLHSSGKAASQPAGQLKLGSLKWNRNHLKGKGSLIYPTCEETTTPLITQNYLHIFQYLFWELLPRMTARYNCWVRCLYYQFVSDLMSLSNIRISEQQETCVSELWLPSHFAFAKTII